MNERLEELAERLRELSTRLKYSKGEAYSLFLEGLSCCFFAKHDRGLKTIDVSRSKFEELGDLNIVRKHGGSIDIDSEVGKGSTFTITLPVSS